MENKLLASLELQLNPLTTYVEQVLKGAAVLAGITAIESQTECDKAAETLNKAKKLASMIDKEVEAICRPVKDWKAKADEMQRAVKAEAELIKNPISEPIKLLEAMITGYVARVREQQQKEQAKQRSIQARIEEISFRGLQFDGVKYASVDGSIHQHEVNDIEFDFAAFIKTLDAAISKRKKAAEKKGEEFVMTGPEEAPVHLATVPVIMAPEVKGMITTWHYEVVNPELVPVEFCSPDAGKLNAAVKAGTRNIPGCNIYSKETIRRTNV